MTTENRERAIFAGGCFWCMEPPYQKMEGVISVTPGYIGGQTENPTYEAVCSGETGHAEAVEIVFDPTVINYRQLVDTFWQQIDPTTENRQFCDMGSQYRTAIFYCDEEQHKIAEASKQQLAQSEMFTDPIVTEIVPATTFYPAESYHCNFHEKSPLRYQSYRKASGRDAYIRGKWGKKE